MREASSVVAILASAVIVLGGLVALVRAILRIRDELRNNTAATGELTNKVDEILRIGGRLDRLERRVVKLERGKVYRVR